MQARAVHGAHQCGKARHLIAFDHPTERHGTRHKGGTIDRSGWGNGGRDGQGLDGVIGTRSGECTEAVVARIAATEQGGGLVVSPRSEVLAAAQ